MLRMSIEDYEKLVDRILSGQASPTEVMSFVKSTPILPLLSKTNAFQNKAIVNVIISDENGNPVKGANVMLAGITKVTDDSGKVTFEFPVDVPPGFIFVQRGMSVNKIPFNGVQVGEKITIAGVLASGCESPMAVGDEIKKIMDTAYKWQILKEAQEKIMNPEFANLPQIGVLKKMGNYEYEIYVPVPVTIKVPPIKYGPIGQPAQIPTPPKPPTPPSIPTPPAPQPVKGYDVAVSVIPSEGVKPIATGINISIMGIDNPAFVLSTAGGFGKYTFHNVPNGRYNLMITSPFGVTRKTITVNNSPVSMQVKISAPPTPAPPIPPPKPPAPPGIPGKAVLTPYGFKAKCPEAVQEVYRVNRCWNWVRSHTYFPFAQLTGTPVWYVSKIEGKLKGGPSELNRNITISLQVKKDGAWETVDTFQIMAYKGEPQPFTAMVNADITDVRFIADDGHYVDYSEIEVYGHPSALPPHGLPVPPTPKPTPKPVPIPIPPPPVPKPPAPPRPPVCKNGDTKVINGMTYICVNGQWKATGWKPPTPPTPPAPPVTPLCREGETKKVKLPTGEYLTLVCEHGTWIKKGITPPPAPPISPPIQPIKPPTPIQPVSPTPIQPTTISVNVKPPANFTGGIMSLTMQGGEVVVFVDNRNYKGSFGKYKFSSIPPGQHTVKVMYRGKIIYQKTIVVNPGETKTIDVVIPSEAIVTTGAIAINVIKGEYAPATPDLTIRTGSITKHIVTYGRVTVPNLQPKAYIVTITDNKTGKTTTKSVTVYAGKTAVISYTVTGKPPESSVVVNVKQQTSTTPVAPTSPPIAPISAPVPTRPISPISPAGRIGTI